MRQGNLSTRSWVCWGPFQGGFGGFWGKRRSTCRGLEYRKGEAGGAKPAPFFRKESGKKGREKMGTESAALTAQGTGPLGALSFRSSGPADLEAFEGCPL